MSVQAVGVTEMVNIEVNGTSMEVPRNSMIIDATDKAGISVPRFCYHRKLSIAANCRMCLVDVEKAPKPVPACATPVTDGMKVYTHSRRAIDAQHGVMEFLLINHPLDCPICDQGGECELQDQAMGFGRSVSRFTERKRVVADHDIGPLIQTDLTRCIQCTRCVRFLDEIAGTFELGLFGRGDRTAIGTSIEQGVDSELSGNIIDLCPVGALTNKPFRYSARAWELMARPTVAMHDGVGSSMWYHTRRGRIMRAVPQDRESTNQTWLSDRDRYSHFGLYADDRVLAPMIKVDGEWRNVSWDEGIRAVAEVLRGAVTTHGDDQLGVLMSASASSEEYFLTQRLARGLDCQNIDHRLREQDFSDDSSCNQTPVFATPMAAIDTADVILLVGANIRFEAPILGQRVRKAWCDGAKVSAVNPVDWNFNFSLANALITAPQNMVSELAAVAGTVSDITGKAIPEFLQAAFKGAKVSEDRREVHRAVAESLTGEGSKMLLLGQSAQAHAQAAWLRCLSRWIAAVTGAALNIVSHGGNATGAAMSGALPGRGPGGSEVDAGLNAREMLTTPLKSYLLWDTEPDFDMANPALAVDTLSAAENVVAVSTFAGKGLKACADVILPLAPAAESEGLFYTLDGQLFELEPAGEVCGEAKPGWKILRQLGAELELEGFSQVDLAAVREEMLTETGQATHSPDEADPDETDLVAAQEVASLHRVGEVAMYSVDALCRRSESLQQTVHAQNNFVGLSSEDAEHLALSDGQQANISQGDEHVTLPVRICGELPVGAVWVKSSIEVASNLGDSFGPIVVEAG